MSRPAWRGGAGSRLHPRHWLPTVVALAVVAGLWQLYAVHNPLVLPTVPSVFDQLGSRPGLYARDAGVTLAEVAIGGGIGFAGAFLIAIVMSELPLVERAVMPLAVGLNVTPLVAIAPALTLMLGTSSTPRYLLAGVVVFFPVLINTLIGLRSADPAVLELARSLDADRREVLWRVRLPSSLPFLFAAARIALPLAVVGAVVAEITASGPANGLGWLILSGQQSLELPTIFAAILVLAAIGIALTLAVVLLERRLLAWHRGPRASASPGFG